MTPAEASDLLSRCAAFDNRQPSVIAANAWSGSLHDVPLDDDAFAAVDRYYGTEPTEDEGRKWIQPHHVRKLRAEIRAERAKDINVGGGKGLPVAVPDADPDDVPAYLAAIREQRSRAAEGHELKPRPIAELVASVGRDVPAEDAPAGRGPLGVECPRCEAKPLRPCVTRSGRRLTIFHPSRIEDGRRADEGLPPRERTNEQQEIEERRAKFLRALSDMQDQSTPNSPKEAS